MYKEYLLLPQDNLIIFTSDDSIKNRILQTTNTKSRCIAHCRRFNTEDERWIFLFIKLILSVFTNIYFFPFHFLQNVGATIKNDNHAPTGNGVLGILGNEIR